MTMQAKRMAECLHIIRWTPSTLANALRTNDDVIERWLSGADEIPTNVGSWVEALTFTHEASDDMRPTLTETENRTARPRKKLEHVPVYSYNLLRSLSQGPVVLRSLFGTDDEAAVFFLVSRGLAERDGDQLIITPAGKKMGEIPAAL